MTNPANVLSITHEEDVGASIDLLRAPFHSAALQGESLEVYVSGNRHQKIDVFGPARLEQIEPNRLTPRTPRI